MPSLHAFAGAPQEKGPFLYVAFLSTLPSVQGNGLGGKLLQHLTAKADAAGKWMFIEATNDRNASLYERWARADSCVMWEQGVTRVDWLIACVACC